MNFIDYYRKNPRGAKICRVTYSHPQKNIRITLYPMMHIASKEFYETISENLKRFDLILFEGTTWHKYRMKRKMYDWFAKGLGLKTQRGNLVYPKNVEKINIDMPVEQFRKRFHNLYIKDRFLFYLIRPLLFIITLIYPKNEILEAMMRREILSERNYNDNHSKYYLILKQRDEYMCKQLDKVLTKYGKSGEMTYIAIVFGLSHMYSINEYLKKLKFRTGRKKWITAINLDDWLKPNWQKKYLSS